MPGDPRECRQHALTCVRLAQTSASPQAREQFASLANTWLRLLLIWNKRGPFSMRWMMRTSRSGEGPRAKRAPTEAEALSLTGPTRLLRQ
jgi:hypothetical protein